MFHSSCISNRKNIKYRCNSNILHCNIIDSTTMSTGAMVTMTTNVIVQIQINISVVVDYTILSDRTFEY